MQIYIYQNTEGIDLYQRHYACKKENRKKDRMNKTHHTYGECKTVMDKKMHGLIYKTT